MDVMIITILLISILLSFVSFFIALSNYLKVGKNKVRFYIARDKNESLWLYLGKPIRVEHMFVKGHGRALTSSYGFQEFGLNENDFDNLKWEDEPVEVFINMED